MSEKFSFGGASTEEIKAAAAANEGGVFKPLPAGWYDVTLKDVKPAKFSDKSAKYAGKDKLRIQFRVATEGDYFGRVVFGDVPLFPKWSPTEKNPDGYPTNFIPFFTALGYDIEKGFEFDSLADLANEILGEDLQIRLSVSKDEYAYNKAVKDHVANGGLESDLDPDDFQRNEVGSFKASGSVPTAKSGGGSKKGVVEL